MISPFHSYLNPVLSQNCHQHGARRVVCGAGTALVYNLKDLLALEKRFCVPLKSFANANATKMDRHFQFLPMLVLTVCLAITLAQAKQNVTCVGDSVVFMQEPILHIYSHNYPTSLDPTDYSIYHCTIHINVSQRSFSFNIG